MLESTKAIGVHMRKFYEELSKAPQRGRKVAYVAGSPTFYLPLKAMDFDILYIDPYGATVSATHIEGPPQAEGLKRGLLPEACGYGRNLLGALWLPQEKKTNPLYAIPKCDLFVGVDVCSALRTGIEIAVRECGRPPIFNFHHLFTQRQEDKEEVIHELTRQYEQYIPFIEDFTHTSFNWDRLRQILVNLKEAMTLRMEAIELAGRAIPSPATFFDWGTALGGVNYTAGTPECIEIFRNVKREVEFKIASGIGAIENERCRLLFMGMMEWPHLGVLARMFAGLGANVIAGLYTHRMFIHRPDLIDPEKPLESLAANSTLFPIVCDIDILAEDIMQMCRDYSIDGLVASHLHSCYPFSTFYFEVADILSRKLGIPSMYFDGDVADPQFLSPARVRTQVETLVESIASRKKYDRSPA